MGAASSDRGGGNAVDSGRLSDSRTNKAAPKLDQFSNQDRVFDYSPYRKSAPTSTIYPYSQGRGRQADRPRNPPRPVVVPWSAIRRHEAWSDEDHEALLIGGALPRPGPTAAGRRPRVPPGATRRVSGVWGRGDGVKAVKGSARVQPTPSATRPRHGPALASAVLAVQVRRV